MDNFALRVAKINGGGVMLISILRVMITRSFLLKDNFRINTFSVTEYINTLEEDDRIPTALIFDFSERARYLYWLFWSCYNLDIDKNNFFQLFNKDLDSKFLWEIKVGKLL